MAIGKYKEAIKDLDKALEINPNLIYAYHTKGEVFEKMGKKEEAIKLYKTFLKYIPEDSPQAKEVNKRIKELGKF